MFRFTIRELLLLTVIAATWISFALRERRPLIAGEGPVEIEYYFDSGHLLLFAIIVATGIGWWIDHRRLAAKRQTE